MINTREIAKEYRLSHWAQVMQERSQSGLSIKAFCRETGICTNTYFYWQRKLRDATFRNLLPEGQEETAHIEKNVAPSGWAVCEVAEPEATEERLTIEIGDCRVLANTDVDPEFLAKVCRVLKSLC